MKKKTILITGSTGFIGNLFLERALRKGYNIIDILRKKNQNNVKIKILKKRYSKTYNSIFYSQLSEINTKLKNKKIDYFINFATLYKNSHSHSEIPFFIQSNIIFPSIVLDLIFKKINKIVNFGTMMQHINGTDHLPLNFYASTKSAFEMILNYYTSQNKNLRFYNLKLYESFAESDNRKKLIPTLIKNFKKNKTTTIVSNKLELNIVHTNDIIEAIDIVLNKNIKSGNYCLKQPKNIKINNLISKINKRSKKKN